MSKIVIFGESDIGSAILKIFPSAEIISKEMCDVRNFFEVNEVIQNQNPEVVVNCAGVSHIQPVKHSDLKNWHEEIEVNLKGSFNIAKAAVENNESTMIIFFASVAGMYGKPFHSGYCASKSAVISLTQSLAMEGYRAFSISPGRVDTKMREKDFPGEDKRTRLTVEEVATIVQRCIEGIYIPGDNIVIRKRGFRKLSRIDRGQPWKNYLNVLPSN